ncbi:MAG: glycosyl transferase family 2 [Candidatus Parcubacteria bacterium]|nr:glycosyl transferase family 2 [Candidatus Parcubacteria bacterium]
MSHQNTTLKKVSVLIPCYNEVGGIANVIKSFPFEKALSQGFLFDIIVIDNNSTDQTADIARAHGATVLFEPMKGKGNAMKRGFYSIPTDTDYVVMLDGDDTYRPEEILRLIEPLHSDFCDVVIGSRLSGRIMNGSMNNLNRAGNWIYSHLVRYFYKVNVTDVLTGYFAWKKSALEDLRPHLYSQGFAIEMEMVTKMAKLNQQICCVPISYHIRAGRTNLSPVRDGIRILWMFTKNLYWAPTIPTKKSLEESKFVSQLQQG